MTDFLNDEMLRMAEKAQLGQQFEDLVLSKEYGLIKNHILDLFDRQAFEAFKKVDASDEVAIVETQMMGKIVDKVFEQITRIIQEGQYAREVLNQEEKEE